MARQKFIDWKPYSGTMALLKHVTTILMEYQAMGYKLTLRQLFYQLVSKDLIPNTVNQYKSLGETVKNARLAGLIDWDMIEDRVRRPESNQHWSSPESILEAAARSYYMDHWVGQEYYVEVWCEKDAVSNIIQPVCEKLDVTFMANRGYSSSSAMYKAHKRIDRKSKAKQAVIIYLGDHDASGVDMTRDINDRMQLFFSQSPRDMDQVDRIALNMDQVEEFNPPPNPAKETDSRSPKYVLEYGPHGWELDALNPQVLAEIVENSIMQYLDVEKFNAVVAEVKEEKKKMAEFIETYGDFGHDG